MPHGIAYHNETIDDDAHWSNRELHNEMNSRFSEPRYLRPITWPNYEVKECRCQLCDLACCPGEKLCICGGRTFTFGRTIKS